MKQFRILLAAVVVLALAAWFASHREQSKFASQEQAVFLPDLAGQLGDIDQVRIHAAGHEPFTLNLVEGQWQLQERGGYPADTVGLRRELRKLAEARALEAKTSQPDYYARLGVQDIEQATDTTVRVTAEADGKLVVDLLIGKASNGGSYVRQADAAQSWLLDTTVNLPAEVPAWLDKALVDLDRQQVQRIEVQPLDGPSYTLSKADADQAEFSLEPEPPRGRQINVANINRLGAALANLRIRDVVTDVPGDLQWTRALYQRFDGLKIRVEVAKQDSDRYLRLRAEADDTASDEVQAEAGQINARADNRSFAMSQYAVDAISMSHEMLLKPPPEDTDNAE